MTDLETLAGYVEKARSVGTLVELVPTEDLPGLLAALWDSLTGSDRGGSRDGNAGRGPAAGPRTSAGEAPCLAALPESGWPGGLRDQVESALVSRGCRIVSPIRTGDGFAWDRALLAKALLGVTYCNVFLAETGSLVVAASPGSGGLTSLLPPVHLALSHPEGCRAILSDTLADLYGALPSRLTLITGPSRTGDIEASMTKGVHGPREVHHWILVEGNTPEGFLTR